MCIIMRYRDHIQVSILSWRLVLSTSVM